MPWEKSYDETEVLDRAVVAFWRSGYGGTSMTELVRATGLNRGSIYAAFTDKRTLFLRSLEHYDQKFCRGILAELQQSNPPREAILALFETAAKGKEGLPGGCLMVNTALEVAPHDEGVARRVQAAVLDVENFFHASIVAAVKDGTVRPDINAERVAHTLLGLVLSIRVLTRAKPHDAAVNSILAQVDELLR